MTRRRQRRGDNTFHFHDTPQSPHQEHAAGRAGVDPLEARFDQLARNPQPSNLEQAARNLFRQGDARLYQVGRHLMESARMLRGGNFDRAEEVFREAWGMTQRISNPAGRLAAAVRLARLTTRRVEKDISGPGSPTTSATVHTPAAGGDRKRSGDQNTYGVVGEETH